MLDAMALLASLVSIRSLSAEEGLAADAVAEVLEGIGLKVNRKGCNVWTEFGAADGPKLMLHSHLDTVAPSSGWDSDPWTPVIAEGRLSGLGANDAKGCVAAMLCAAERLSAQVKKLGGRVLLALTAEEETGGAGGISGLRQELGRPDAAVFGEPTGLGLCNAQGGMLLLRCQARGDSGHAAHAGALGLRNAIHIAARDVCRLEEMEIEAYQSSLGQLESPRPQVTLIQGGISANQVPDSCEFRVDIRTTPLNLHEDLLGQIRNKLESEVQCLSWRYHPVATDPAASLVQAALAAGSGPLFYSRTVSDWSLFAGQPSVKVGPGASERSHQPNEYILESELKAGIDFYEGLVLEYFRRMGNA